MAPLLEVTRLASITFLVCLFPTGRLNLGFLLREKLAAVLIIPSLGVPNCTVKNHQHRAASRLFSGAVAGEKEDFCKGSFARMSFTLFIVLLLLYFYLHCFIKNTKKISFLYSCFYLSAFSFARMATLENTKLCDFTSTNNSDFICTPVVPPAPAADFYEIEPALLNLVMKEQFSGSSIDDAVAHLNNFVELCQMQKYKDVESDIIKLKLFFFSLRGKAKDWLLSLPKNSIDSWAKCKDALLVDTILLLRL
jgi:hypothetical protein